MPCSVPAERSSAALIRAASQPARNIDTTPATTPQMPKPSPMFCHWPGSRGSTAAKPTPAPSASSTSHTPKPKKKPAKSAPQLTRFASGALVAQTFAMFVSSRGQDRPPAGRVDIHGPGRYPGPAITRPPPGVAGSRAVATPGPHAAPSRGSRA
ncbi:MAG: hypothetical protein QM704_25855 [Anaeromyxobacteraceae bacterium]